jgi:hypothetical protein
MNQDPSYARLIDTVMETGKDVGTMTAFAALVAAAEREACAKLVEDAMWFTKFLVAKSIRARGETK